MIFPAAHIIWHPFPATCPEPGDIINTGTPQGVAPSGKFPYLRQGDGMEISIEKLGRQEQKPVSYTKQ